MDQGAVGSDSSARGRAARAVGSGAVDWLARWRPDWRAWRAWNLSDPAVVAGVLLLLEMATIVAWTVVVTRPYLDLDPMVVPTGREYLHIIQPHHFWTRVKECGWCALWNGNLQGGSPAMADPFGSTLHPLVMVGTLGWGVPNGAKLALVGAFLMAGLAQWWLGRVLGLGRVACVWSACMAVAGGHLAGRMEMGALVSIVSTAACALVLPPLILVVRMGTGRAAVLLGIALGLVAVSGQGYMQAGLALISPAALLLVPWGRDQIARTGRQVASALLIAALLAAPFVIPFFHLVPALSRQADPSFNAFQPMAYIPLNLVIDDLRFQTSDALAKVPYPSHNVLFVGWLAVLLALWGVHAAWDRGARRIVLLLVGLIVLSFWFGSGAPLKWLADNIPVQPIAEQFTRLRFGTLMTGLAVAPVLGLAAIGLDDLLRKAWPQLKLMVSIRSARPLTLPLVLDPRLLLVIPLLMALGDARAFGMPWIGTGRLGAEIVRTLEALRTADLQWVSTPFGEHAWIEPAAGLRLKLADGTQTWRMGGRTFPEPVLAAARPGAPPGMNPDPVRLVDGLAIYAAPPGREYAAVTDAAGERTACTAHGLGGDMDIVCDTRMGGALMVFENQWSGWQATVDGETVALRGEKWLELDVPPGRREIRLRFRPWDVPLGLLLFFGGVGLSAYQWRLDGGRKVNGAADRWEATFW